MFERIGENVYKLASKTPIWTNVYGLARSLMAGMLALILVVNPAELIFIPAQGISEFPQCSNNISLFCFGAGDYLTLNILRWLVIILLLIIASGWRPRYTGILHFYIAYSYHEAAMVIDGGDQVHLVLTLLLMPVTLCDSRKWHWKNVGVRKDINKTYLYRFMLSIIALTIIRVQISIIYLNAAYAKVTEEFWINGTAVYYFLNDYMLGLNNLLDPILTPLLGTQFVVLLTWGTIVIEFLLFAALITPKKYWVYFLIPGILLHTGIAVTIGLYSFSMFMIAALILFLRPLDQPFSFSLFSIKDKLFWRIPLKKNKNYYSSGISYTKFKRD